MAATGKLTTLRELLWVTRQRVDLGELTFELQGAGARVRLVLGPMDVEQLAEALHEGVKKWREELERVERALRGTP